MRFEHAVLVAEVSVAECAVADDALSGILALLEVATGFAGGHDDVFWREVFGERVEDGWMRWKWLQRVPRKKNFPALEKCKVYKGRVAMLECQRRRRKIASLYGAFGDVSDNGRDNDSQSNLKLRWIR